MLYFSYSTALRTLALNENSLKTLDQSVFHVVNHPSSLTYFRIHDNPDLQCDYSLCWLKTLDTTWITVADPATTICGGPGAVNCHPWDQLTTQDLCTGNFLSCDLVM